MSKMKEYRRSKPQSKMKDTLDPLKLMNGMESPVSFNKMIREIESRKSYIPNPSSIALYLYWMAKLNAPSEYIVNATLNELDLTRGKFNSREAFGFYRGALGLDVPKSILAIAREEYSRVAQQDLSGSLNRYQRAG